MTPDDATLDRVLDLDTLNLPAKPKVDEIRWERYVDWQGEDALQVWIVLDDATRTQDLKGARTPIQRAVHDALLRAGIELFPFLRLVTHAELAETAAED